MINKKLKAFNMVEIMIVICLLAITVILCIPTIFNNTKEAKIISGWKKLYGEMHSNFEVFNVSDAQTIRTICAENIKDKESEIFKVINPYFNVDTEKSTNSLKTYNYRLKNGSHVPKQSNIYTRLFAYQENGNIVAFKWLSCNCTETEPCAAALFDMNGTKKPNKIGEDIFGLYLYKGRIEAFGAELTNEELEETCSKNSGGMNCSEYYLRGGKF